MSESETASGRDTEGVAKAREQAREQIADQQRELSEAEKQKRRVMEAKTRVDPDEPPVSVSAPDDEVYEFDVLPEARRIWVENTMLDFVGFDEEDLTGEQGQRMREVKNEVNNILGEHAVADAFDSEFWANYYGVEAKFTLVNDIHERAEERAGNRR